MGKGKNNVPDVVVSIPEELSQDIDRHHPKRVLGVNLENREHRLVQDGVSNVLGGFSIGRDL